MTVFRCTKCGQVVYKFCERGITWKTPEERDSIIKDMEKEEKGVVYAKESVTYNPGTYHSETIIFITKDDIKKLKEWGEISNLHDMWEITERIPVEMMYGVHSGWYGFKEQLIRDLNELHERRKKAGEEEYPYGLNKVD